MKINTYLSFSTSGIMNTENVLKAVKVCLAEDQISKIVISSTTGYTAFRAEEVLKTNIDIIICKQDISNTYSMPKDVEDKLKAKYAVYDIPRKYLQNLIGLPGTNLLRKISQGLVEYLLEMSLLKEKERIIVIAGTLKGADTAVVIEVLQHKTYCIDRILCLPQVTG